MSKTAISTRRRYKRYFLAALPIAIVIAGTAIYVLRPHPPSTLADALLSKSEQFPKGQKLLAPLSNQDRLGYEMNSEPSSNAATAEPSPCFYVAPNEHPGLLQLEVDYRDRGAINQELGGSIAQLAGSGTDETLAHVHIAGVGVVTGLGFPNLNGPCRFQEITGKKTFSIVTTEVRADQLEVKLSERHRRGAKATTTSNGTGRSELKWEVSGDSSLVAKDIVLSAATTDVVVRVSPAVRLKLGDVPRNMVVDLFQPLAVDGKLTVVEFDRVPGHRLTLRANFETLPLQERKGVKTFQCVGGEDHVLAAGEPCIYWLVPGTTAVTASWAEESHDLYLDLRSYQTSFAAQ